MKHDRIESYVALAATPAVIGGFATADIYHYDGPAISVTTNGVPPGSGSLGSAFVGSFKNFIFGGGSLTFEVSLEAGAFQTNVAGAGDYGRAAGLRANGTGSGSEAGFVAINGDNRKNAQRFSYSQKIAPGPDNVAERGVVIGGSGSGSTDGKGVFNGSSEERGYVGVFILGPDNQDRWGWLDIGYNFDTNTLTMYEWAFNDEGMLNAGHLTVVPGPAGLFALAAGAAGIRRRRNRVA